ncbi:hypothetical protein [Bacteroides sp. UBA939]|uniref:hypothetical protein n=1 Tax=Bacteroides sp. UBA939 TaxID=1946092 RepID=UPI0025BD967F|nr:hypothetical protein [Bacteroides sp. UBA939]
MQTLLNDIELNVQELKYLMQVLTTDANPALRVVAKRNIQQIHERLDALQKLLDENPVAASVTTSFTSSILGERIKPVTDLRHAISLNDSFRFAREIFAGDTECMNATISQLGSAPSLDKALELFSTTINVDEENEAIADFVELLKKYFS